METLTIIFTDQFGCQHEIESNMPEKFAKRECESYLYELGNDAPSVTIISIN